MSEAQKFEAWLRRTNPKMAKKMLTRPTRLNPHEEVAIANQIRNSRWGMR